MQGKTERNQIWRPHLPEPARTDSPQMQPIPQQQLAGNPKENPCNYDCFTRSLLTYQLQYKAQSLYLWMHGWPNYAPPVHHCTATCNQCIPCPWTPVRPMGGHHLPGIVPPTYCPSRPLPLHPSAICVQMPEIMRSSSVGSVSDESRSSASPTASSTGSDVTDSNTQSPSTNRSDDSDTEIVVVNDNNKCKYCDKVLSDDNSQHQKRCKIKHEGKYRCSMCLKTYSQSHTLKQHMHSHTGLRPYECRYCIKRFSDVSTRNKHERIHTGKKPYRCPECRRGFSQSGNMYRHMDKIHGEAITFLYRLGNKNKNRLLQEVAPRSA